MLPSATALPKTPSPKVTWYLPFSTSCKKKTLDVESNPVIPVASV